MQRITLSGLLKRRGAGNSVVEVPSRAFDEAVTARDEQSEARAQARASQFDEKLKGVRGKMTEKTKTSEKASQFWTTVRNWAIGIGLLIYGYLFLQFGPVLLGCTAALVVAGGAVYLFFKFRPKDDDDDEKDKKK